MRLLVFLLFCSLYLVSPLRSSATPLIVTRDPAKPQQGLTVSTATLTSTGRATFVTVTATTGTFGNLVFTTGSLPGTLTAGMGLSGSSYNGSTNRTWTVDSTYIKGLFSATLPITCSAGVIAANSNITALNTYGSYDGNTYYWINPTYFSPGAGDNNAITGNAYSVRLGQDLNITNSGTSTFIGADQTATGNGVNFSYKNIGIGYNLSMVPRASTGEMTHVVSIGADSGTAADFTTNIGYDNWAFEHASSNIGTHCFNWGFASGIYGGQWLWNRSGGSYAAILGGLYVSNNGAYSSILSSTYVNNNADNNLVFAPNGVTTVTLSTASRAYLFPHGSGGLILNGNTPTSGYEVDFQSADVRINGNALITGTGTIGSTVYPGTYTQGDILYASAANTLSALAKNATATRYLSNTGTSNNPAWAQVDVTNGITGTVPVGNGGTGTSTAFTAGSVVFAGASGVYTQNNSGFFWDNTNTRIGVGTASPQRSVTIKDPSNTSILQFTNATAGTTNADGLIIGINSSAAPLIYNYENTDLGIATNNAYKLQIKADGQIRFGNPSPDSSNDDYSENHIYDLSGAKLTAGGTWTNASSRKLKILDGTLTGTRALDIVATVPIYKWEGKALSERIQMKDGRLITKSAARDEWRATKNDNDNTTGGASRFREWIATETSGTTQVRVNQRSGEKHIGPVAEEFKAATRDLGICDGESIASSDMTAVLWAAVKEQQRQIADLRSRIAALETTK